MLTSNCKLILTDINIPKQICYLKRYNDFLGFCPKTDEGIVLFALLKLGEYFEHCDKSLISDGWIGDSSSCADCIDDYT